MIYLDNAATTFPKPKCVATEISNCINKYCGNSGRSGHILSVKSAEKIYECREKIASFLGSKHPENVVFTFNTTYALNIAINTLYEKNSHVLISNMEHNSVIRPIHALMDNGEISYDIFNVLQPDELILKDILRLKKDNTKMLILTHASNIIGKIFPIKKIGDFCKKNNITFIVDAAQSAGISEINIADMNISALCAPAHKGLYGPQGLGFVIFEKELPKRGFIYGGNGINSLSVTMGSNLPESLESGTCPTPLVAGLCASLDWINKIGIENIRNHEINLAKILHDNINEIKGSVLFGNLPLQSGVVLFKSTRLSTDYLSYQLDKINVCTRGGFHCSPLAHRSLGTGENGAIRLSLSIFNTEKEIKEVSHLISKICR